MSDSGELMDIARLGIDSEAWLKTPLGRHIHGKALREEAEAIDALVLAAPDDVRTNTELRNQIHVARMFMVWLTDAINAGHQAHEQLQEMDDMEQAINRR